MCGDAGLTMSKSVIGDRLATGSVKVAVDATKTGYFEVKLADDNTVNLLIGAVRPNTDHNDHQWSNNGYFLYTWNGALYGGDKHGTSKVGGDASLKKGDRVGVLVNLTRQRSGGGTIMFFVNGKQFGNGFTEGVVGPLVLGVQLCFANQSVVLLPDAVAPRSLINN